MTHRGGVIVEPYFSMRALLLAAEEGFPSAPLAQALVDWLAAYQRPDGTLPRLCLSGDEWRDCGNADADDASLATWLELSGKLAVRAHLGGSRAAAARHLAELRRADGLYRISKTSDVALLMDNLEVWAAMGALAAEALDSGDTEIARQWAESGTSLAGAIMKEFWDAGKREFTVSSQGYTGGAFYPHGVAQIYPLLFGFDAHTRDPAASLDTWLTGHGAAWLSMEADSYPWGVLAIIAARFGRTDAAGCWMQRAQHLRYSPRWSVLDEVALQVLEIKLRPSATDCSLAARPRAGADSTGP